MSHSPTKHELHIARTFALSWEQLNPADEIDVLARKMLTHIACLAPGEPIPADWLGKTLDTGDDGLMATLLAEDSLTRLAALGLLELEGSQIVVLHRFASLIYTGDVW